MTAIQQASAEGASRRYFPAAFPRRHVRVRPGAVVRTLLLAAVALWGVLTIVFFGTLLTGNPAHVLASPTATKAQLAELSAQYGFDRPLAEQYVRFLGNLALGRYPESLRLGGNPFDQLLPALPFTLALAAASLLLGIAIGVSAGYASVFAGSRTIREVPLIVLAVFQSTPVFIVGLALVLLFSVTLGWLPTAGARTPQSIVLPALTLALLVAPRIAQVSRASLLQQLGADHVRAAAAKRIPMRIVRSRHVVGNSLIPLISVIGLELGGLLGGSVITESLFSWPGIGALTVTAIENKDYPVIIAAVVLIAAVFIVVNTVVDLLIARLDPRAEVAA